MIKRFLQWIYKNKFEYSILYIDNRGVIQHIPVALCNSPSVGDSITFRDLNDEVHYRKVKCLNWYINVDRGETVVNIELKDFK